MGWFRKSFKVFGSIFKTWDGMLFAMLYGATQEGLVGDGFREGCILLYVGGGEGCRQERRNCIVCGAIGRCETHWIIHKQLASVRPLTLYI